MAKRFLVVATLIGMGVMPLSVSAELPKSLTKVRELFGLSHKSNPPTISMAQVNISDEPVQAVVPDEIAAVPDDLSVLETQPNHLHGIDGVHTGKVPLKNISPATLKTFVQAVDLMRREYIDVVDDEQLFNHAINGMLNRTDRNAEFLDAAAFANLQSFTGGNIAGVGLKAAWQMIENHWVITEVTDGSPADMAGIKKGDYLHQIGEIKLNASHNDNDITQLLNGIAGTSVEVSVSNAGRYKRNENLLRNQTQKSSIDTFVRDGVVIVKLPIFQNNTRQQILESVSQIGSPIQGIVLDVRNNPGGVLESAVDVASLFMRKKTVTQIQNRQGVERVLETQGSPIFEAVPVIILQNRYSASAAEVLSSALQSQRRALVVGESSYGKGSVQSVIPLGNQQAIKLTTAHYLTPMGKKIDGVGVLPDVSYDNMPVGTLGDEWLTRTLTLMDQGKLSAEDAIEFAPIGGF